MNRDVLYRVGVVDHPDAGPRLKAMAERVRATMNDIETAVVRVGTAADRMAQQRFSMPSPTAASVVGAAPTVAQQTATPGAATRTVTGNYQAQIGRLNGLTADSVVGNQTRTTGVQIPPSAPAVIGAGPSYQPVVTVTGSPGGSGSGSAPVPSAGPEKSTAAGRADAQTYSKAFISAMAQMTGLTEDELMIALGTDKQRMETIGKENANAYRKGLRDSMSQGLGLDDDTANELFGVKNGKPESQQQEEDFQAKAYKDRNSALDENVAKLAQIESASKSLSKTMGANFRDIAERVEGGSAALGQFAQGIGFLAAGNEDFEKFVKTLATIKGVTDVGVGAVKMFTNLAQMVTVFTDRSDLSNQKQELAAKKQKALTEATRAYTQILNQEGNELAEANARLSEHAKQLDQVAKSAARAAAAEKAKDAAIDATSVSGPKTKPKGRFGGLLAGAGSLLGGSVLSGLGGGSIVQSLGNMGLDMLINKLSGGFGRAAAGAAGTAATGAATSAAAGAAGSAAAGAAGTAAAGGAAAGGVAAGGATIGGVALGGSVAVAVGAAVAALGSLALVGTELTEIFSGTANKVGSVTDTIASWEVKIVDWVGDMTGFFDVVGGSKQAAKADKALEERKKNDELNQVKNSNASKQQVMERTAEQTIADRKRADAAGNRGLNAESGADRLFGMKLNRENLQRELSGQQTIAQLQSGDQSFGGRMKQQQTQETIRKLQEQLQNANASISGTEAAGGQTAKSQLEAERLSLAKELKQVMESIGTLEKDTAVNYEEYVHQLGRASDLGQRIKKNDEDMLGVIRQQKEERTRANQEAVDGMQKRLDAIKREKEAAQATLKSGAERFAQMSRGEQFSAVRAQRLVDSGNIERLTDRQRGLLRSVGTQKAVAAAEQADQIEARKRGFFQTFGREEQGKIAAATAEERKLNVQIENTQAINVKLEADYQKMAVMTANMVKPIIEKAQANFEAKVREELLRNRRDAQIQANEETSRIRTAKNL